MRSLSSELLAAQQATTSRPVTTARVYHSRAYFSGLWSDNSPAWKTSIFYYNNTTPIPQDTIYNPTSGRFMTVLTKTDGGTTTLVGMFDNANTEYAILGAGVTQALSKPTLYLDGSTLYLFYVGPSQYVYRATLNTSNFAVIGGSTVQLDSFSYSPSAALHAISPNCVAVIFVYYNTISCRIHYRPASTWTGILSTKQLVFPRLAAVNVVSNLYSTALADWSGSSLTSLRCYVTDPDTGGVASLTYHFASAEWEDPGTAIAGDLSRFEVCGSAKYGSRYYLIGRLTRTGDLNTPGDWTAYTILTSSSDGYTFALERNSLLAVRNQAYRYQPIIKTDQDGVVRLYGCDTNRIARDRMPDVDYITLSSDDILNFSAQHSLQNSGASLILANSHETFTAHPYLVKGNRVEVYQGYQGASGPLTTLYGVYTLSGLQEDWADARRNLQLQLTHLGIEHISHYTSPFYTEITAQTSVHDNLENLGGFYPATRAGVPATTVPIDFWDSEPWAPTGIAGINLIVNGGNTVFESPGIHAYGVQTADLKDHLNLIDYPQVKRANIAYNVLQDITVELYGWSRTTATGHVADQICPYLIIERADGSEVVISPSARISTYDRWPLAYYDQQPGSLPISFRFDQATSGLTIGDKIKRVAVTILNGQNATHFYLERVDLKDVAAIYSDGKTNTPWMMKKADGSYAVDGVPGAAYLKELGRPYIMLAQKPHSAKTFSVWAHFKMTDNIMSTNTCFGLVGFASDNANYLVGRYRRLASGGIFEILMVREGQYYSIATEATALVLTDVTLMFRHIHGQLELLRLVNEDTWVWCVQAAIYSAPHQGALSTSADGIYHVGVYGMIKPAGAQINGFKYTPPSESGDNIVLEGIGILPSTSNGINFAASGQIQIGSARYAYTSLAATSANLRGPFQARRTDHWSDDLHSIDHTWFNTQLAANTLAGTLLATDNGIGWRIDTSTWVIYMAGSDGVSRLRDRSRHYGAKISGNYLSASTRIWPATGFILNADAGQMTNPQAHNYGDFAYQYVPDEIGLTGFGASGGDMDGSIASMLRTICAMAGVVGQPRQYTFSVTALAGSLTYLRRAYSGHYSPHGFDVTLVIPGLTIDGQYVGINTSAAFDDGSAPPYGFNIVARRYSSTSLHITTLNANLAIMETIKIASDPASSHTLRLVMYGNFCVVFCEGKWVHTFIFKSVDYSNMDKPCTDIYIRTSINLTNMSVTIADIAKWRDGIFIEMSAPTQSALGSIIQERPISIIPHYDGSLEFAYLSSLTDLSATPALELHTDTLRSHQVTQTINPEACSDAVLYYADVAVAKDTAFAIDNGYACRILSLPNLEADEATFAANLILRSAREHEEVHQITLRPDLRLEPGDIIRVQYDISATNTHRDTGSLLIESVSLESPKNSMAVTAYKRIQD